MISAFFPDIVSIEQCLLNVTRKFQAICDSSLPFSSLCDSARRSIIHLGTLLRLRIEATQTHAQFSSQLCQRCSLRSLSGNETTCQMFIYLPFPSVFYTHASFALASFETIVKLKFSVLNIFNKRIVATFIVGRHVTTMIYFQRLPCFRNVKNNEECLFFPLRRAALQTISLYNCVNARVIAIFGGEDSISVDLLPEV